MPTRIRKKIDEIDGRWGSVIQFVVGTLVLLLAAATFVLAVKVGQTSDQTNRVAKNNQTLVVDGQASRFVNTEAACRADNESNENIRRFVLDLGSRPRPAESAAERKKRQEAAQKILLVYFPNEPECDYVAFKKVCSAQFRKVNPKCVDYAGRYNVARSAARYQARQLALRKAKAASPATTAR